MRPPDVAPDGSAAPPESDPPDVPPEGGDGGYDARREARRLLRTVRSGALATLAGDGGPYASLVTVATLPDGSPVLTLSTLAVHTRHLLADPRCSLLLDSAGTGDPLIHPRLTVTARAVMETPEHRALWRSRFLRRHPTAEIYVDFGDFSFWRLDIAAARIIGGFGRIDTLTPAELLADTAGAGALIDAEPRAVDHMNADHRDAIALYATVLCGAVAGDWRISGLDPDGIDMTLKDLTIRLNFPARITDPATLRQQLVRWADEARSRSNQV